MPRAPRAERRNYRHTQHCIDRVDPYHWLRACNWQDVLGDTSCLADHIGSYLKQENHHTDRFFEQLPLQQNALVEELRSRLPAFDPDLPERDGPYAYYWRYAPGAEHAIFARVPAAQEYVATISLQDETIPLEEQLLLDCDKEASGHGYFELGECEVSPDHTLLAWTADFDGSERPELFVRNLVSGEDTVLGIDSVASLTWADSETLFYVRLDQSLRATQVFRQRLGEPAVAVYHEADPAFDVAVGRMRSGEYVDIVSCSETEDEVRLVRCDDPEQSPLLVQARSDGLEYSVEQHGSSLIILTNEGGATDFKLMLTALATPGREHWRDLLPHSPGQLLLSVDAFSDWLVWSRRCDGNVQIEWIATRHLSVNTLIDAAYVSVLRFDDIAYELELEPSPEYHSQTFRVRFDTPTKPATLSDVMFADGAVRHRWTETVPGGYSEQDYRVQRIHAKSHDCVNVPITVVCHRDTVLEGSAPALLEVYGSYGSSLSCSFDAHRLSLLQRGWVYVLVHARGGQECGRQWYEQGRGSQKANTFHDIEAAAQALVANRICSAQKLALVGRSAGGLAVGAVVNRHPSLFKAVIADVPFVDVLNTMLDETLPLTPGEWAEWGNPIASLDDYRLIASYCPYQNVQQQAYPAMYVSTALADPRVGYWEPVKWVASIRQHNTGDEPLVLRVHSDAGHGGVAGRYASLGALAEEFRFLLSVVTPEH